jgi:hypothetical protein
MSIHIPSNNAASILDSVQNGVKDSTHLGLQDNWTLYYHLPHDNNWNLSSYKIIMNEIDSMDKIVALNETIPENIIKYCMLFIMKKGITPLWEDPRNRTGGCFSYKVTNKMVYQIWKILLYKLCGGTLCVNKEYNNSINGITISPKKNFCIIKIWLNNCNNQDPNIISIVRDLSNEGCLFKKHEPEF